MGNLTLVSQGLNTALLDAPWDQGQLTLDKYAVLHLNKDRMLNGPLIWDESTIVERWSRLYSVTIKV